MMPSPFHVTVRPAQIRDLPAIRHIARLTWDATYPGIAPANRHDFLRRAYSNEQLKTALDSPRDWFYVADGQEQIVGYAHFLRRADHNAELARLYVLPDYQRRGVGTALLQHGLAALAAARYRLCYVAMFIDNRIAQHFYQKHGFVFHRDFGQPLGNQLLRLVEYKLALTGDSRRNEPTL